jgi:hypothetical protein
MSTICYVDTAQGNHSVTQVVVQAPLVSQSATGNPFEIEPHPVAISPVKACFLRTTGQLEPVVNKTNCRRTIDPIFMGADGNSDLESL